MERENQFSAAADQMPYLKDAGAAASETAILFREYLSMPVLAIYASREGEPELSNILPKEADSTGQANRPAAFEVDARFPHVGVREQLLGAANHKAIGPDG